MQGRYRSIETPLFIIWGAEDAWLPSEIGDRLHEYIPGSFFMTVPGCGHNPHEECPERVNPVVVEFLAKHDESHIKPGKEET
ncbi:alpha/beta fold hydrolase [Thermodesulfobacteriota bacterium]